MLKTTKRIHDPAIEENDVPVRAFTSRTMAPNTEHLPELGFTDYASKPTREDVVMEIVKRALRAQY